LRFDLGREITVAVSSAVLIATFAYVFNDFLNVEVAALSKPMRDRFAFYAASVTLFLAAAATGRCLRAERTARRGLGATAAALGETHGTVTAYRNAVGATLTACLHGGAWWLVWRWLVRWDVTSIAAVEAAMLAFSLLVAACGGSDRKPVAGTAPRAPAPSAARPPRAETLTPVAVMCRWRLRQIVLAARSTRTALACAACFMLLAGVAAGIGLPLFVSAVAALAGGFLVGLCLCFQMAEDLEYAWFERCLGVAHGDFEAAYERAGLGLGIGAALVACLCFLVGTLAGSAGLTGGSPVAALTTGAVAAIPSVIAPSLLLQIDGRRVFVTSLTLLIVSLFIATAVVAHWLSLVLIPLLRYFAKNSQAGRFYRA
jgi:hypothetical protein